MNNKPSSSDAVYGLGTIGALVYFIQNASTAWEVIVGIFKALFWPAFLVYHALGFLRI